jgi:hypothetical protein
MPWIEGFNRRLALLVQVFQEVGARHREPTPPASGRPNLAIARSYEKPRYIRPSESGSR